MEYNPLASKQQARLDWIDIAKGYGIILVIFGHIGSGIVENWLYTFHVPLFFFLSGFVVNIEYNSKTFIKKKIKSLVIPYFTYGIPVLLFLFGKAFLRNELNWIWALSLIKDFLIQRRFSTFWFIACLFCVNIIFYFLSKAINNPLYLSTMVILLGVIGLTYNKMIGIALPWNIDISFVMIAFFYGGFITKRYCKIHELVNNKRIAFILFLVFLTINIVSGYFNYIIHGSKVDIVWGSYGYEPLMFLSAFAGIASTICFSMLYSIRIIRYIGKNSMIYYLWHGSIVLPIIINILSVMHLSFPDNGSFFSQYSYKLFVLILVILCLCIISIIISKTKLRMIFGR